MKTINLSGMIFGVIPAIALSLWTALSPIASTADTDLVVRILERSLADRVTVGAPSPFDISWDGGRVEEDRVTLVTDGGPMLALTAGGETRRVPAPVTITSKIPETILTVTAESDEHRYRGSLVVSHEKGKILLINTVALEDYLLSVVPSELSTTEPEAMRAQAILCRTFALKNKGRHGDWDLCDLTHCQHYAGAALETALGTRAVRETARLILTYGGLPAEVFYHSSSGGMTTSPKYVWGGPDIPYLVPKRDVLAGRDLSAASPDSTWRLAVTKDRLLAALSDAVGLTVTGISVTDRDPSGRAAAVRLAGVGREIMGEEFRIIVCRRLGWGSLKSTLFEVNETGGSYVFDGKGLGHGVGMSQWGAVELSRMGKDFREILEFYFPGTAIEPAAP